MTKSPETSASTSISIEAVTATPLSFVTVALSVPLPQRAEADRLALGVPSFGVRVASVEGVSDHVTALVSRLGERSALTTTPPPGSNVSEGEDSSIPVSSGTARTWTGETPNTELLARSVTVIFASPTPTAVTRPLPSTVNTEVSEDSQMTSELSAGRMSYKASKAMDCPGASTVPPGRRDRNDGAASPLGETTPEC